MEDKKLKNENKDSSEFIKNNICDSKLNSIKDTHNHRANTTSKANILTIDSNVGSE